MQSYNIQEAARNLPALAFHTFSSFNKGSVGVFRAARETSPWELHPDDDELLYVVEGEIEITTLGAAGPVTSVISSGEIFVVPRGVWHRQTIARPTVQVWITPGDTKHSMAEDPRGEATP
jgi:quercetin dioxygenase-like cupin family protein